MRILVTGANGQLGRCLRDVVDSMQTDNKTAELYFDWTDITTDNHTTKLDICDQKAVTDYIEYNNIDVVVNCAAYTAVDTAENDYDNALLLNTLAPDFLASAIEDRNGFMIHISTDYVFDGAANIPYKETDLCNPLSVYGKTKLKAEEHIINGHPNLKSIVLRTAWLYSEYGKNFVKTMKKLISENDNVNVVSDQIGTPTYAGNLATAIYYIILNYALGDMDNKYGIYHFTNTGVASWYDFAHEINSYVRCETVVIPCSSSEFKTVAKRPFYSVLDKSKFINTFPGFYIPHWRDALTDCMLKLNALEHETLAN